MALELIVRPYQRTSPSSTRRLISTRAIVEVDEAKLSWGNTGQLPEKIEVPVGEPPPLYGFEVKKKKEQFETARVTEKVRVENPDDPDQYVVVERTKSIRFKEKDPDTVKALPYTKGSVTVVGGPDIEDWQPGETRVNTDGSGPLQKGEQRIDVPLKIENRDFLFKSAEGFYTSLPPVEP